MQISFGLTDLEIKRLYFEGKSRKELAELCGIRYNSFGHVLKRAGCYEGRVERVEGLRSIGTCNRDFFEVESFELYYFIGYMFGDGCLTKKESRLYGRVSSIDKEVIDMFYDWIRPKQAICVKVYKMGYKNGYDLTFNDEVGINRLLTSGIVERKSNEGIEPVVPEKWFWSFFVGLVDSDGFISGINNGEGRRICLYGYFKLMSWIDKELKLRGICSTFIQRKDGLWVVGVYKIDEVIRIWNEVKGYNFKNMRKWGRIESWPRLLR